eukprot:m.109101 g.109101  ORF g.109101 m.109101 type:complete len:66 (-) comp15954_c0_seq1:1558-1755(-)
MVGVSAHNPLSLRRSTLNLATVLLATVMSSRGLGLRATTATTDTEIIPCHRLGLRANTAGKLGSP